MKILVLKIDANKEPNNHFSSPHFSQQSINIKNLVSSNKSIKVELPPLKVSKADFVLSVSPSSERIEEFWGVI